MQITSRRAQPVIFLIAPCLLDKERARKYVMMDSLQGFKSGSQRRLSILIPVRDEAAKAVSPPEEEQRHR